MSNEFLLKLLNKRLLLHVLFWSVFIFSYSLGFIGFNDTWDFLLANWLGVLVVYFVYINLCLSFSYGYLIQRKQFVLGLLSFVVLLLLATNLNAWLYNITSKDGRQISFQNFVPLYIFYAAFTIALKVARSAYLNLHREIELKQDLINQKEYFLRSQIHPHFLFNTLNNFYGLALQKSDELPGLMIRLSNILRHQIYHSESSYISIEKEVSYLTDYIELEKIRYGENLSFQFSVPQEIPENAFIIPSVLIVFFENAFKHSNNISTHLIEISGYIKLEDEMMKFYLENTYPEKPFVNQENEQGLGLKNVKKRLNLFGEQNHVLKIEKSNGKYMVSLEMKYIQK